jgi:phosphate transport system protein
VQSVRAGVVELFALVGEAIARATWALLAADVALAEQVIADEVAINQKAAALQDAAWALVDAGGLPPRQLREVVTTLLMVPELERSADLAEHIAQRAAAALGGEMSPVSRGIVTRMGDVAVGLWQATAAAFGTGTPPATDLDEADDELDVLHERLTTEVASGAMTPTAAAQVTLLARFYERLGDHAVNLWRRSSAAEAGAQPG